MAKGTGFKKFNSADRELTLVQENIDSALSQLQLNSISNGLLLSGVALVVGDNVVTHKLGRKCRGYLVVSVSGATALYDNLGSGSDVEQNFILNSSAACTASLWVF